jgi:hypothetical protein
MGRILRKEKRLHMHKKHKIEKMVREGADLWDANLESTDLEGTDLEGIKVNEYTNFQGVDKDILFYLSLHHPVLGKNIKKWTT